MTMNKELPSDRNRVNSVNCEGFGRRGRNDIDAASELRCPTAGRLDHPIKVSINCSIDSPLVVRSGTHDGQKALAAIILRASFDFRGLKIHMLHDSIPVNDAHTSVEIVEHHCSAL